MTDHQTMCNRYNESMSLAQREEVRRRCNELINVIFPNGVPAVLFRGICEDVLAGREV